MSATFRPVPIPAAASRAIAPLLEPGEIVWPIPLAGPFFASTHGRVFSFRKGRAKLCPGTVVKDGYRQSHLTLDDGTTIRPHLHRLIALTYDGPSPVDPLGRRHEVHHIDGDRTNNAPGNLRYEAKSDHARLSVRGREGHVKLDEVTVWVARCRALTEPVARVVASVAAEVGCTGTAVRRALKGVTWTHVPMPVDVADVVELAGALGVGADRAAGLLALAGPTRRAA